jgi:hypothetical protein
MDIHAEVSQDYDNRVYLPCSVAGGKNSFTMNNRSAEFNAISKSEHSLLAGNYQRNLIVLPQIIRISSTVELSQKSTLSLCLFTREARKICCA